VPPDAVAAPPDVEAALDDEEDEEDDDVERPGSLTSNSVALSPVTFSIIIHIKIIKYVEYSVIRFLKEKIYIIIMVALLSGCVHQLPSTLEVAAHGVKTVYNKCSDLDNWQCLWYDNKY
jgi:hypothetical protein